MSYILDALKKIEHEKVKKSSPGATPSISGGLFNERKPAGRAGGRKIVVILVLVVLASAATFGITWFALKGDGNKQVATTQSVAPAVAPPVVPQPVPLPAPPQPQLQPQPQPVAPPVVKPLAAPVEVVPPEEEPGRKLTIRKKNTAAPLPSPQLATPARQPVMPTRQSAQPAGQAVPPPADIKVSGIAWQDEHSARRAVVNGFLLKEGSVVAGAKITAIMTDRVRFSSPSGVFELRLDASSPGDQKR